MLANSTSLHINHDVENLVNTAFTLKYGLCPFLSYTFRIFDLLSVWSTQSAHVLGGL